MAAIAPQTDVYLLKVPLEIDETNQLTFANTTAQYNYFSNLPKVIFDNFTYQRKDETIRVPALVDDIMQYNYVMYRNESYSNKWFYAFITGMEYINDHVTAVKIKTDVWQTWQFDLTYKPVFVEREHVNNDTIGANTIDEGIDLGEFVINSATTLKPDKTVVDSDGAAINWIHPIFFQVTELYGTAGGTSQWYNAEYNRIFSGLYYFACCSFTDARSIINQYASAGKSDAIVSIFMAPKEFLNGAVKISGNGATIYIPANSPYLSTMKDTTTVSRPATLNGYTPKNNKLFTAPFSYIYATNNAGIDTTFHFEDFANATPKFYMAGALGQGCAIKLCPVDYKSHNGESFEYGITGAKYPVCAWTSDYYTNWCTQNAVNIGASFGKVGLGAAVGVLSPFGGTGALIAGGASLLSTALSAMAKHYEASVVPDQAKGNTNTSDLLLGWERYYTIDCMSIRSEVARSIDEYFSTFGYKVNRVKVPNITGRTNWNYVKTIGCYIQADIPQEDLEEIKSMFDKGITFWHNPATFADYSQNNDII